MDALRHQDSGLVLLVVVVLNYKNAQRDNCAVQTVVEEVASVIYMNETLKKENFVFI